MNYTIEERLLPLQPTAAIHASVPLAQLGLWLQQAYQEISEVLA